ncbi:MAG: hypothetical protein JSS02_08670 [Planctomycetes bacterium]|nr:hypothetical protein [Planctomycetota bacterium]
MSKQEFVLVVDEISDTADVLQAVLEPRGVAVNRVRQLDAKSAANTAAQPRVMVVDADNLRGAESASSPAWHNVPQIIIGKIQFAPSAADDEQQATPPRRFLQKPFQFAELMQVIESLI